MIARLGKLEPVPAHPPDLLAPAVAAALAALDGKLPAAGVAEIDPELADTAAFCERYGVAADESANCVVVSRPARRRDQVRRLRGARHHPRRRQRRGPAPARRAQGVVRRRWTWRSPRPAWSTAGSPRSAFRRAWPIFVDAAVAAAPQVVIGSGVRRSKLTLPGEALGRLPGAAILDELGR